MVKSLEEVKKTVNAIEAAGRHSVAGACVPWSKVLLYGSHGSCGAFRQALWTAELQRGATLPNPTARGVDPSDSHDS